MLRPTPRRGAIRPARLLRIPAALFLGLAGATPLAATAPDDPPPAPETDADCIPAAALATYVQRRWERRVDQWRSLPRQNANIVFLGSSIIEEGPWSELFPESAVVNRGIGADTTTGVLDRLDEVVALRPDKILLYIGGNDFSVLNDSEGAATARFDQIIRRLNDALPATEIFVATLFAREARFAESIERYNRHLVARAAEGGFTLIDGHPLFAREDGSMDSRYSNDEIHLNGDAYRRWAALLRPFLVSGR
ncbi:GDSL-type esterase/lipase family protein [Parasphingopyxis algicola]|uniref:GDSL-type esterase/lipase family protein n=1 Tax=Parasphingopyxis algicola TaxID=2026624 RepID=UPI001FE3F802|nr:GDSL-type esterase/lipase family protein [Parasphingopyxis algicola]